MRDEDRTVGGSAWRTVHSRVGTDQTQHVGAAARAAASLGINAAAAAGVLAYLDGFDLIMPATVASVTFNINVNGPGGASLQYPVGGANSAAGVLTSSQRFNPPLSGTSIFVNVAAGASTSAYDLNVYGYQA